MNAGDSANTETGPDDGANIDPDEGEEAIRQACSSARPSIALEPGRLPEIVDRAEHELVTRAEELKLFQRGSEVVHVISLDRETVTRMNKRDGLERPEGAVVLHPVTAIALGEILDRLIEWCVLGDDGTPTRKDCPAKIPLRYLSRVGSWRLPYLVGVIEAPILRPDGTALSKPGYDPQTGLYLNSSNRWLGIPEHPTRADAENGLRTLCEPFDEFPFVGEEDRSVLLAGILTAVQRRLLESAPLFGFSAPGQRTGKTRLVESIGVIASGRIPAAAGASAEGEELRKAITSILREGHLIAHLDNITRSLDSPDLARAITTVGLYSDRLLGSNTILHLPTNVMWTATGNNLTFRGDMATRTVLCRIDAQLEHPEERTFRIPDLHGYLHQSRRRLVIAALTILRAYHVAGRPRQDIKPWGGFDQWSREIREPLVWLGCADPCQTRARIVVSDPDREAALSVLSSWYDSFGDRAMPVAELINQAAAELTPKLLMIAARRDDPNAIDPRRLGAWCRSVEDRIFDGLRLSRDGSKHRATPWRVSAVSSASSKPAGPIRDIGGSHPDDMAEGASSSSFEFNQAGTNSPNSPDSPEKAGTAEPNGADRGASATEMEDLDEP